MPDQDFIQELLKGNNEELKLSEKQVKVLEAAIEIFSEKGYAATSTNEIAKKAGVAEGTIFRHYKTKKDLLITIVTPTMIKLSTNFFAKNIVKEVFNNQFISYEDFLRTLIKNRFEFAKKHLPLPILKIFLQEVSFHQELRTQVSKAFNEHVFDKFVSIIKYFQDRGEIINIPPETIIRITITNIMGLVVTRYMILPQLDWDEEREIEHTIQFLLNGLTGNKE